MTTNDVSCWDAPLPPSSGRGASLEAALLVDDASLAELARQIADPPALAPPHLRKVARPAAARRRHRGPRSRLLSILRVSSDYLVPALMMAAAAVWLLVLARAADHLG